MASPTPVLPEVGSTIVPPGRSFPSFSAASIMARPIRSLLEPPGLRNSSFASSVGGTSAPKRSSLHDRRRADQVEQRRVAPLTGRRLRGPRGAGRIRTFPQRDQRTGGWPAAGRSRTIRPCTTSATRASPSLHDRADRRRTWRPAARATSAHSGIGVACSLASRWSWTGGPRWPGCSLELRGDARGRPPVGSRRRARRARSSTRRRDRRAVRRPRQMRRAPSTVPLRAVRAWISTVSPLCGAWIIRPCPM